MTLDHVFRLADGGNCEPGSHCESRCWVSARDKSADFRISVGCARTLRLSSYGGSGGRMHLQGMERLGVARSTDTI
jgi:hypothetical protein